MSIRDGIIDLNRRRFKFVKPTIAAFIEILKHDYENKFTALDFKKIAEGGDEYEKFEQLWREFCNSIFKKSIFWRLFSCFGYMPRELRFTSLRMNEIGEIIKSFFDWQGEGQKPQDEPSATS